MALDERMTIGELIEKCKTAQMCFVCVLKLKETPAVWMTTGDAPKDSPAFELPLCDRCLQIQKGLNLKITAVSI